MAGSASSALLARQRAATDLDDQGKAASPGGKAAEQTSKPPRRKGPLATIRAKAHKSVKAMLTRMAGFD